MRFILTFLVCLFPLFALSNNYKVILEEYKTKGDARQAFEGFQNIKTQETIINKVRQKCWDYHQNGI